MHTHMLSVQRMQKREQFDEMLKDREQARIAALQKYVSLPLSSCPSVSSSVGLQVTAGSAAAGLSVSASGDAAAPQLSAERLLMIASRA